MLFIITVIAGFYIAWNIGANDVGNNMGTSVSAGSLSYKKAIILAAIFEFLGAFFVGGHVIRTIRSNIINIDYSSIDPYIFALGMLSVIISSGLWITFVTLKKMPVSTTHSIIGALLGFGMVAYGFSAINWKMIMLITLSWILSPLIGALISSLIFNIYRLFIYDSENPFRRLQRVAPFFVFTVAFFLSLATIYKGLANLKLDLPFVPALLISILVGVISAFVSIVYFRRKKPSENEVDDVENFSKILHVISAAYECFAHGANDVANAIGPVAAIIIFISTGQILIEAEIPMWLLFLGAAGIVAGVVTFGHKVMDTIGKRITEITPSRGFAAEFAAATTVLFGSRLGIPLSTTHISVGAVAGIGMSRGIGTINLKVLFQIFISWFLTVPISAISCILVYLFITKIIVKT